MEGRPAMNDPLNTLNTLKRPRLLINAARLGAADYRREAHLPRHLGTPTPARAADALAQLIEIEETFESNRRRRMAGYSAARHVEILAAMMGEARGLRKTDPG